MTTYVFTKDNIKDLSRIYQENAEKMINAALLALGMRVYNALAEKTPVRTGYLRLTLGVGVGDQVMDFAPPERDPKATEGFYLADAVEAVAAAQAMLANFRSGTIAEFGYTAEYAPYVEDRYHMVKETKAELDGMIAQIRDEVLPT